MRTAFFKAMEPIYRQDSDVVIMTCDLGYKLFDPFKDIDPSRFINAGVAEANMIGLAAGQSLCGKKVYCYSIIPFLVMRPFEQIRVDVAYHNLDVKLVGVGGGFAYGLEGITHHGLEDIALMRVLPNMTVVTPADPLEAERMAELSYQHCGPIFIRLCHTNEPSVYQSKPDIKIGKIKILKEGSRAAILATGRMVHEGMQAVDILKGTGISPTLVNVHTIKPLDNMGINEVISKHEMTLVIEEHSVYGGLGSAIAELAADISYRGKIRRLGISENKKQYGEPDFLRKIHGLTAENIAEIIKSELRET